MRRSRISHTECVLHRNRAPEERRAVDVTRAFRSPKSQRNNDKSKSDRCHRPRLALVQISPTTTTEDQKHLDHQSWSTEQQGNSHQSPRRPTSRQTEVPVVDLMPETSRGEKKQNSEPEVTEITNPLGSATKPRRRRRTFKETVATEAKNRASKKIHHGVCERGTAPTKSHWEQT